MQVVISVYYTSCTTATMGFILISCTNLINLLSIKIPFFFFLVMYVTLTVLVRVNVPQQTVPASQQSFSVIQ